VRIEGGEGEGEQKAKTVEVKPTKAGSAEAAAEKLSARIPRISDWTSTTDPRRTGKRSMGYFFVTEPSLSFRRAAPPSG